MNIFNKSKLVLKYPNHVINRLMYNSKRSFLDMLYPLGIYNYKYQSIFLAGMALSGSTWIKNLLSQIPGYFTRSTPMPIEIAINQDICDSAFSEIPKIGNTLFKTHLNPTKNNIDCISRNGVDKILVSYRDLRDVSISMYYRLLDFPKDDFLDYRTLSKKEAIDHSIETIAEDFIPWINGWKEYSSHNESKIYFIRFEDLKSDTKSIFKKILDFYEIEIDEKKIEKIISNSKGKGDVINNMQASQILPWGISSNFRKGGVGYWKNEMDEEQINRCKEVFGDILIQLNYEKDLKWRKMNRRFLK